MDKNGDGQEKTTTVDKDGNVIDDPDPTPVGPGLAPPPSKDGPTASNDKSDPNNPQEPAQPDHPDTGGDSGGDHPDDPDAGGHPDTGMPPDDGGGEDDSPPLPRGLAGLGDPRGIGGFVAAAFNGRTLDDDEATPTQRVQALLGHLTPVAAGDGSDIDDGVGEGIVIDIPLDPPSGSDGDWGDITNPRALTAFAASLAAATQGIASIGNMVGGSEI